MKNPLPLVVTLALAGVGAFGFLYQRAQSRLGELQASHSKLNADRESLARQTEELKALVKSKGAVTLAPAATVVTNSASVAELAQLREELAAARERLARLDEPREERTEPRRETTAPGEPPRPEEMAERFRTRMEEWKTRDPEGFARMTQSIEERRKEMDQGIRERLAFIGSIDTSGLSEEYATNHRAVVEKLQKAQEIFAQASSDPLNPENMERGREAYGMMRELEDAMKVEREILLYDLAGSAGYQGDKAKEFVQYLDQVNKMTSVPRMSRGGPGGDWRGRDGGRDGGRPPEGGGGR